MDIWDVGLGADLSQKDCLHILEPFHLQPGEWGVRLSDVSMSDCCFLLQVAYVLQDWWLAYW